MDHTFREAERAYAFSPTELNLRALNRQRVRYGLKPLLVPRELEVAEEFQDHYDELWWHRKRGLRCGLWGDGGFWDVDFKPGIFKAHHDWGHTWQRRSSKRKTLKTHRNIKCSKGFRPRN